MYDQGDVKQSRERKPCSQETNSTNENSFQEARSMGSWTQGKEGITYSASGLGLARAWPAWVSNLTEANSVKSWRMRCVYVIDKQGFAPFYILYMSKLPGAWLRWVTFIFRDYYTSSSSVSSSKASCHDRRLPWLAKWRESRIRGQRKHQERQVTGIARPSPSFRSISSISCFFRNSSQFREKQVIQELNFSPWASGNCCNASVCTETTRKLFNGHWCSKSQSFDTCVVFEISIPMIIKWRGSCPPVIHHLEKQRQPVSMTFSSPRSRSPLP